jgi:hypothetical protein
VTVSNAATHLVASVRSKRDSYDNAMAGALNSRPTPNTFASRSFRPHGARTSERHRHRHRDRRRGLRRLLPARLVPPIEHQRENPVTKGAVDELHRRATSGGQREQSGHVTG